MSSKSTTKKAAKKAGVKKKAPKPRQGLTTQQERFCEFVAAGDNQTDAYIKAGYKTSRANASKNAARMTANDGIKRRIAELSAKTPDIVAARLTKEEKLAFLAELIRTPIGSITPENKLCAEYIVEEIVAEKNIVIKKRVKIFDKLRAIELHSKLMGHFEPDRTEIELGNTTLLSLKERAAEVGYALSRSYNSGTPAKSRS